MTRMEEEADIQAMTEAELREKTIGLLQENIAAQRELIRTKERHIQLLQEKAERLKGTLDMETRVAWLEIENRERKIGVLEYELSVARRIGNIFIVLFFGTVIGWVWDWLT